MITNQFDVNSEGFVRLHCTSHQPDGPSRAVLFVVHGLGEHSGRYAELISNFTDHGIAVFIFDLRGHGLSTGKRGHAASIDQFVEDAGYALMQCRNEFLDHPIFMFGHSMGGQIVATFLSRNKSKEISGAIISSAWFQLVKPAPSWILSLVRGIKALFPSLTVPNGLNPDSVSSVTQEVEAYKNDPLVHNRVSVALVHSLYHNGLLLLKNTQHTAMKMLVCHGEKDEITSMKGSQEYTRLLGERATFLMWPGARHEPHHDHDKQNVLNKYVSWVEENTPKTALIV